MAARNMDGKNRFAGFSLVFAAGLLGMIFVVWPEVAGGRIPGDLGDARFNSYMLEHFHLWINGRLAHGFFNAPFNYPFPWMTEFSDNFLGTGPLYSLLRCAGCDREDALRWWYVAGYAANYAACAYVLSRLGLRPLGAAAGAFIFTFNMAALVQGTHMQLCWRCGIPPAVYYFYRAVWGDGRQGRLADWLWCFMWFTWQACACIYTGVFLAMLLAAFAVGLVVENVPRRLRGGARLQDIFVAPVRAAWRDAGAARRWLVAGGMLLTACALAGLLYPYALVSRLYGLERPWFVVFQMLPRPLSYFFSYNSRLWAWSFRFFGDLRVRAEQSLFPGAAVWLLFAAAAWRIARGRAGEAGRRLFAPLLLATLCMVLMTTTVSHKTLYKLVFDLPGMSAIRAVGRIVLTLLFPIAVVCASGVDALRARARARAGGGRGSAAANAVLAVVLAGLVAEAVCIRHTNTAKEQWDERLAPMQAALDAMQLPDAKQLPAGARPVLFVPLSRDELFVFTELDGMLLAQRNGLETLNGYSGSCPPGVELQFNSPGVNNRINAWFYFAGITDESRVRALAERVLVWNGRAFERARWTGMPRPLAGPLPREAMAGTVLEPRGVEVAGRRLNVDLRVENKSQSTLPSISSTGRNVSISWAFAPAGSEAAPEQLKWDARWRLQGDIPPGRSDTAELRGIDAPKTAGDYVIWFSMVQDGVTWFHDAGMKPVRGAGRIRVGQDGAVTVLPL